MKNPAKMLATISCAAIAMIGLSSAVKADPWNKKTIITINEPMQIPTKVLEPGKYVFKLLDSNYRHVVQVFNEDESKILATIVAIPNERLKARSKSEFDFWEVPAGQPHALRAWFYPGDNFGHEFAYNPEMAAKITAYNKTSVPTTYAESDTDLTTAKIEQSKVETAPEVAQVTTPAPAPAPEVTVAVPVEAPAPQPAAEVAVAAAPAPEPAPVASERIQADRPPAELPHTGSSDPAIAFGGLLSLAMFAILSRRAKQTS